MKWIVLVILSGASLAMIITCLFSLRNDAAELVRLVSTWRQQWGLQVEITGRQYAKLDADMAAIQADPLAGVTASQAEWAKDKFKTDAVWNIHDAYIDQPSASLTGQTAADLRARVQTLEAALAAAERRIKEQRMPESDRVQDLDREKETLLDRIRAQDSELAMIRGSEAQLIHSNGCLAQHARLMDGEVAAIRRQLTESQNIRHEQIDQTGILQRELADVIAARVEADILLKEAHSLLKAMQGETEAAHKELNLLRSRIVTTDTLNGQQKDRIAELEEQLASCLDSWADDRKQFHEQVSALREEIEARSKRIGELALPWADTVRWVRQNGRGRWSFYQNGAEIGDFPLLYDLCEYIDQERLTVESGPTPDQFRGATLTAHDPPQTAVNIAEAERPLF